MWLEIGLGLGMGSSKQPSTLIVAEESTVRCAIKCHQTDC